MARNLTKWPFSTCLILVYEFCLNVSYMGATLTLYMLNGLEMTGSQAIVFFNLFHILRNVIPLFSSILADCYIGRYKTIKYASFLQITGLILMNISSMYYANEYKPLFHPLMDLTGMAFYMIALAGYLPCVVTLGGDQFEPDQKRMMSLFFSLFYVARNAGAFVSSFTMPIIRSYACFGRDSCYPVAFAESAIAMTVGTLLLIAGSSRYKKHEPANNLIWDVYRVVKIALKNKRSSKNKDRHHWLDYYLDTHICEKDQQCTQFHQLNNGKGCAKKQFIEDIRSLIRLSVMFLPLPMFWALYDIQYSVWLVQSIQMDNRLWGGVKLLADQVLIMNPLLIIVLIFIFDSIIYPITSKFVKLTSLRKMCAGGFIAAFALILSALVQLEIDRTQPELPSPTNAFVSVMNTFDNCRVNATLLDENDRPKSSRSIQPNTSLENRQLAGINELFDVRAGSVTWKIDYEGEECSPGRGLDLPSSLTYEVRSGGIYFIYIGLNGALISETNPKKPTNGNGEFSLSITMALSQITYSDSLVLCRHENSSSKYPCDTKKGDGFYSYLNPSDVNRIANYDRNTTQTSGKATIFRSKAVRPGRWQLYYMNDESNLSNVSDTGIELDVQDQGGVYVMVITGDKDKPQKRLFQVAPESSVSILWQMPQILLITIAEVLFSLTAYEFAYTQSAVSMKALVQAIRYLSIAAGDLVIIAVTLVNFGNMVTQFFVYAAAMVVVMIAFTLLSIFYYEYKEGSKDALIMAK